LQTAHENTLNKRSGRTLPLSYGDYYLKGIEGGDALVVALRTSGARLESDDAL